MRVSKSDHPSCASKAHLGRAAARQRALNNCAEMSCFLESIAHAVKGFDHFEILVHHLEFLA
jgi:hypothetical protein